MAADNKSSADGTMRRKAAIVGILVAMICALSVVGSSASADESPATPPLRPTVTANDRSEATTLEDLEAQLTDPELSEELPRTSLTRGEAGELLGGVFDLQLEAPTGIYENLDPERFVSDYAAIVQADSVDSAGVVVGEEGEPEEGLHLLESSIPLRVLDGQGEDAPVDLSLEGDAAELRPANPLVDVVIPRTLEDGLSLLDGDIEISMPGISQERSANILDGTVAFYPNVDRDTDFAVAAAPGGLETFTHVRSPEAPMAQEFELDIPAGAELVEDNGAAKLVDGSGNLLLKVEHPWALDAEGKEVPVEMSVSGNSITVAIEPKPWSAYPILVDPLFQTYQWYELTTTQGTDDFKVESTQSAPFRTGTSWSPYLINPGLYLNSPGLFVQALNGENLTTPGAYRAWRYYVPRYQQDIAAYGTAPQSYISRMFIHKYGFFIRNQDPAAFPYNDWTPSPELWAGIYNIKTYSWASSFGHNGSYGPIENFNTTFDFYGNSQDAKVAQPLSLSVTQPRNMGDNFRTAYAGYVQIEVADTLPPTWGPATGTGWIDNTPVPVTTPVTDKGLGVAGVWFRHSGGTAFPHTWVKPTCTGLASSPCPREYMAKFSSYNPASMPTGIYYVSMEAGDPLGNATPELNMATIKVDHTNPVVSVSGTITQQGTLGPSKPSYTVNAVATDGAEGAPQSGIETLRIAVDGEPIGVWSPGCTGNNNCQLSKEAVINGANYGYGHHTLEVKAWDEVGRTTTKTVDFKIRHDKTPPQIVLSGSMTEQGTKGSSLPRYGIKAVATDPLESVDGMEYSSSFGTFGNGTGQFNFPGDVAVDSKGNLWVADSNNNRVQKFSETGQHLLSWSTATGVQLQRPTAVAVDAADNVWIADSLNNRLVQIAGGGGFLRKVGTLGAANGQFKQPEGVTVDAKGNVWVADTGNGRVVKLSSTGGYLSSFGTKGTGVGQLAQPTSLDVSAAGDVWVTDYQSNRLTRFTEGGSFVQHVGSSGAGNGQFVNPGAIDIDSSGNLWVVEQGNQRVQKFSSSGQFLYKFGQGGEAAGRFAFRYPMGIAVDAKGRAWISDQENSRVQVWTASNAFSSGLNTTQFKMDGVPIFSIPQNCPNGGCSQTKEWTLISNNYSAGQHTVEAVSKDMAGNESTKVLNIQIVRDTVAPTLDASGVFYGAQEGWVDQTSYAYDASALDAGGVGVSSITLKVDGAVVKETTFPSCLLGECSGSLTGSLNAAQYSGGAHSAELIAKDFAGNVRKRTWSMNVNPSGAVSSGEIAETLEAYEDTGEESPVAATAELLDPVQRALGDDPDLVREGSTIYSQGVPTLTSMKDNVTGGFTIDGADGSLTIKPVGVTSVSTGITNGVAAVSSNVRTGVDMVVRPQYNGAMAFADIRGASSPETFSWNMTLDSEQTAEQVDDHTAVVRFIGGPNIFLITAEEAHDATGKAVPTTLSVSGKVLTLTVHHKSASVVYPVLAGQAYETSYHPAVVTGPLVNPEPTPSESGEESEAEEEAASAAEPLSQAETDDVLGFISAAAGSHRDKNKIVTLKQAKRLVRVQRNGKVEAPVLARAGVDEWEKIYHVPASVCSSVNCDIWSVQFASQTRYALVRTKNKAGIREYARKYGEIHCGHSVNDWWTWNINLDTTLAGYNGDVTVDKGSGEHLSFWCKYNIMIYPLPELYMLDEERTLCSWIFANGYISNFTQARNTRIVQN